MDVNNIRDNIKREIKAEMKPKRLLRTALVPQTKGLLTPLKEVFEVFVLLIAQIFVSAKLITRDHPAATKELKGLNAIWLMIVDASSNLKFKRENLYQIIVFYGIVGMLVFGTLDFLSFLLNFGMGHAHAQALNNTNSLFNESNAGTDNGPVWINSMFPYANNAGSASGLPGALGAMLRTYNSALLALGTALALYQLMTLFMESAHHGKYGGTRHSQLYAPLRMVIGIGLLVPTSSGFNSAQIIAIDMAKMGSGLASNVWLTFQNQLNSLSNNSAEAPVSEVNTMMQKLIVDETCMVATQDQNSNGTTEPTWTDHETGFSDINGSETGTTAEGDNTVNAFTITFDNQQGDSYCGTLSIPAQQSGAGQMAQVNYFEQAFVNNSTGASLSGVTNGILHDVWTVATDIYTISKGMGGSSTYSPTQNPFKTNGPSGSAGATDINKTYADWIGQPGSATAGSATSNSSSGQAGNNGCSTGGAASYSGGSGEIATMQAASAGAYTQYNTSIACASSSSNQNVTTSDWTKAGFLFLQMTHNAQDLYTMQNPNISVSLPDSTIMYLVNGGTNNCSTMNSLKGIFGLGPFACQSSGETVANAISNAVQDVTNAAKSAGMAPVTFDPNSNGSGNDSGKLNSALQGPLDTMISGIKEAYCNSGASGLSASGCSGGTTPPYALGQSIFNVMLLGNIMLVLTGLLYILGALSGASPFTIPLGLIISFIGTTLLPIGISLAIMIPLMPAARFIFGIFCWLMTLFEGVIAMPLVALVSIRSDGEGLFAHGQAGWFFLLQMMFRPVLMIFGLLGSVLIFDTLAKFINLTVFGTWFSLFHTGGTGMLSALLGIIGFMYFYVFTMYSCANVCFQMINTIPDRVLSWIGLQGISANDDTGNILTRSGQEAGNRMGFAADAISGGVRGALAENKARNTEGGGTVQGIGGPAGGNSNASANNNQFVSAGGAGAAPAQIAGPSSNAPPPPTSTTGAPPPPLPAGSSTTNVAPPPLPGASVVGSGSNGSQFAGDRSSGKALGESFAAMGSNMSQSASSRSTANQILGDQGEINGSPQGAPDGGGGGDDTAAEEAANPPGDTGAAPSPDAPPAAIAAPAAVAAAVGAAAGVTGAKVGARQAGGIGRMAAAVTAARATSAAASSQSSNTSGGNIAPAASGSNAQPPAGGAEGVANTVGGQSTGDAAGNGSIPPAVNSGNTVPTGNNDSASGGNQFYGDKVRASELQLTPGGRGTGQAKLSTFEAAMVGAANAGLNSAYAGSNSMLRSGLESIKNQKSGDGKNGTDISSGNQPTQQPGNLTPGQKLSSSTSADDEKDEDKGKGEAPVEAKAPESVAYQGKMTQTLDRLMQKIPIGRS